MIDKLTSRLLLFAGPVDLGSSPGGHWSMRPNAFVEYAQRMDTHWITLTASLLERIDAAPRR